MKDCIATGLQQGVLSADEAQSLSKAYDDYLRTTGNPAEARRMTMDLIAAEIEHRNRIALQMEERRKPLVAELSGFRDRLGQIDMPFAFRLMHDKMGHEGRFAPNDKDPYAGLSAEEIKDALMARVIMTLEDGIWEFRGGFISGDLRRTSKTIAKLSPRARAAQARAENVQREMRGEKTGDEKAARLAGVYMKLAEELRIEFNRLGGTVGKLDNWGGPQQHNQLALIDYGRAAWIEYMMADGVLDKPRMLHPLTQKPMTAAQLRESLGVAWDRITTDGAPNRDANGELLEMTGAPIGRGALYKQHADHRFLHFTPDGWIKYAKDFGNPDFHAAMMSHFAVMARDIAHMTKFGPNPERMRRYLISYIENQAKLTNPVAAVIAEQKAKLLELSGRLSTPNPEYRELADKLERLQTELYRARGDIRGGFTAMRFPPGRDSTPAEKARIQQLTLEMENIARELNPFRDGSKPMTIEDTAVATAMRELLDAMRDPIMIARVSDAVGYARSSARFADHVWEQQRGAVSAPFVTKVNIFRGWQWDVGATFDTIRNVVTASSLHSAVISAISDPVFGATRRAFVGMSAAEANPVRVLKETIRIMASERDTRYARRAGVVADVAIGAWKAQARYNGAIDTRRMSGFIADRVLQMQGLTPYTAAGKAAFGLDLMGFMADQIATPWARLDDDVRRMLDRAGFTPDSWDTIRRATPDEPREGATFLRPDDIEAVAGRDLALRYQAMILREMHYAVPEASPTSSAHLLGGTTPGTVGGMLARSFAQFKSFGVSVIMLQGGQIAAELGAGRKLSAAQYAGTMLLGGVLFGALASALKDINSGRDPKKWLDEKTYLDLNFWGAALLQAGGLGIYGDFLFSNLNRHGGSLPATVAGPIWGRLDNLRNLTVGNVQQAIQGKPTNFAGEGFRFLNQNTPHVLFTKLAWERTIMDQVQLLLDKNAAAAFARADQSRRREYNQESWWPAGRPAPVRAPDLSRIPATR